MSMTINGGTVTAQIGHPFAATKMTVPPHRAAVLESWLRREGVPFVNGKPNPSMQQLIDLRLKLAAEGVVFE